MTFNEVQDIVNDEVMLFKSGYEYVPFMCDVGGKNDKIFESIFKKLPMKRSTVGDRDVSIGQKKMYKIHVDDIPLFLECLHRLHKKSNDPEIGGWIDDIQYHLKHFKRQDPL